MDCTPINGTVGLMIVLSAFMLGMVVMKFTEFLNQEREGDDY